MVVCKCTEPSWHVGTLNSHAVASPLVRLVEREERTSQDMLASSKCREDVPHRNELCTSGVYTPGRVTLDETKASPITMIPNS
ncbi:hypothetical protein TNCV_3033351 [Trichonephila clavipes]|nr:hypothetical protein TNCV_3033351 [Trichonephila clavipes]